MKHSKLLAVFTTVILSLAALGALAGCAQQQTYTPPENSPVINTPSLIKEGVLTVGVDTSNAPLAGTASSSGKIVGIDVDVASALADELGLKVEFVDVGSDGASALSDGKVDVVMGVNKSTEDGSFWVSDEYLPTSIALFSSSSSTQVPSSSSSSKFGAQASSTSSWAVTNQFENATLDTSGDLNSVFAGLSKGSVDYVAADVVKGMYSASRQDMSVSIVALMQSVSGYGVGVSDSKTELKQAISDALSTITSNGVVDVIECKWLGADLDLSSVPMTDAASAAISSNADAATTDNTPDAAADANASTGAETEQSGDQAAEQATATEASTETAAASDTASESSESGSTEASAQEAA